MTGFTIRAVERRDVAAVIGLVTDVLAEFGLAFGDGSETDKVLVDLPEAYTASGGAFWVAVDDAGELLGTAGVLPLGHARGDWELRKMYLRPRARGLGVGKGLLAEVITFARSGGAGAIVLDTIEAMRLAIAFYERHGFVRDDAAIRGSRCSRGYRLALAAG